MLIYKQRYKPRTTREFTKNDLTVYDSAGNTALNALTVYGKSEVVDGVIKSAGEGWATVDLGTLNWIIYNDIFFASITDILPGTSYNAKRAMFCKKYTKPPINPSSWSLLPDKNMLKNDATELFIHDTDYTDAATFKSAMNGVLLCYELANHAQGNTIAVKTDNGTGIDGTMAVFETGTPLRGIPDTTVRDVMVWYDSSGEVTKYCNKVRLADLTWNYNSNLRLFNASLPTATIHQGQEKGDKCLCIKYEDINNYLIPFNNWNSFPNGYISCGCGYDYGGYINLVIKDTDYTTVEDFVTSLGDAELVYELATPTTEQLTTAENASIAGLRTFAPQTHAQNNAQTEMTVDYTIKVPTI